MFHVQHQNTAINELGATPPVDIFPVLKLLPGWMAPWRRWAGRIGSEYRGLMWRLVRECRENAERKGEDALDCFLMKMLREREKNGLDEEHIAYIGATLVSFVILLRQVGKS